MPTSHCILFAIIVIKLKVFIIPTQSNLFNLSWTSNVWRSSSLVLIATCNNSIATKFTRLWIQLLRSLIVYIVLLNIETLTSKLYKNYVLQKYLMIYYVLYKTSLTMEWFDTYSKIRYVVYTNEGLDKEAIIRAKSNRKSTTSMKRRNCICEEWQK